MLLHMREDVGRQCGALFWRLAMLCVMLVFGDVRSNETGKAVQPLGEMRIFESFLARSKMIYIRKLLTALWFREELRLEAVSVDAVPGEKIGCLH